MSAEKTDVTKKTFTPDWLVRGVLTKIGETFDRLTGRNWQPSSSLATSELTERLKRMLDAKVKDEGEERGKFVPHRIKLKMQWDKFSTDAEDSLKALENELLTAAVDHINDNRYHTYAPLNVEVKTDYFTDGVDLYVGFEDFDKEAGEEISKVTMPSTDLRQINIGEPVPEPPPKPEVEKFAVRYRTAGGVEKETEISLTPGKRLQVGRNRENDLAIDDASVSKIHASLVLNADNTLSVADTGSTNGTFINGQRISYGKAFTFGEGDRVMFGTVETFFRRIPKPVEFGGRETFNYTASTTAEEPNKTIAVPAAPPEIRGESEKQNFGQTEPRVNLDFDESRK